MIRCMYEFAVSAFTTLIVVLDPIGLIPIYLSLTAGLTLAQRRLTALWAIGLAALIMIGSALFGQQLLHHLGISLAAFRIAGGLLLFYTAFEMVFDTRQQRRRSAAIDVEQQEPAHTIAAFPLAVPLLAGPGAITACILLSARAADTVSGTVVLVGSIIAACAMSLAMFLAAEPIDRLLGTTGKIVLTRLFGVLLAALAVQFVADGAVEILRGDA